MKLLTTLVSSLLLLSSTNLCANDVDDFRKMRAVVAIDMIKVNTEYFGATKQEALNLTSEMSFNIYKALYESSNLRDDCMQTAIDFGDDYYREIVKPNPEITNRSAKRRMVIGAGKFKELAESLVWLTCEQINIDKSAN